MIRRLDEPRVAVPVLLGLAVLFRLHNLGESLWFDEVVYSTHYRSPDLDRLWTLVMRVPGPPLYFILAYFWVALVGDHEVVVRLPSMCLGIGSIVLTYFIARRFSSGGAPFLAALLLCVSPAHIWYSQEATPYAMTMFCVLAVVYVWPRVTTPPFSWTPYASYLGLFLAAVFSHFYAAVFLLPFTLLALTKAKPVRYRILLANAVIILSLAAWLGVRHAGGSLPRAPLFLRSFTLFEWWMLFFQWFLHGNSLWTISPGRASPGYLLRAPGVLALQIGFAILVLRGLWPGRPTDSRVSAWELALYLCGLPLVMYLLTVATDRRLYIERYLVIGLPFFAMALAMGATRFSNATVRAGVACAVLMIAIASYAAFVRKDFEWTVYKQNPDWRSAVAFLRSENERPEQLLLLGVVPLDDFAYYLRKEWPDRRPSLRWYTPRRFRRLTAGRAVKQVVLVKNRFMAGGIDDAVERVREDRRLQSTTIRSFKGVDLYTFVPRTAVKPEPAK